MRGVRFADGRVWHLLRAHAVHLTVTSVAFTTAYFIGREFFGVRQQPDVAVTACVAALVPGLAGLVLGYSFRHRLAVVAAVGVAFLLRLALALFLAGAVRLDRPAWRAWLVVMLVGLLAGLSAEGVMIARPPPRPD